MNNLRILLKVLKNLREKPYQHKFYIPHIWIDDSNSNSIEINPYDFFIERINKILELSQSKNNNSDIVYNLFVRFATAFDHLGVGTLFEQPTNAFRQTGTFLKSIAILPYLKNLGVGTLYLLPITSIGKYGKKGNLGSPYSINNPYKFDDNLSEPILGLPIETQFLALVEAAHLLGIKVILEFVFRTTSIDSELAQQHPNWFYWIKDNNEIFKPPKFDDETLEKIKSKVFKNDFSKLPAPPKEYIERFTNPPKQVFRLENGKLVAYDEKNELITIPSAFADWPPDDNQPLWSDVTYLKLYDNPKFNYIAYNTIRMYDTELLASEYENRSLWEHIQNIIPYYIQKYDIDGVMVDMGHALPEKLMKSIINKARLIKQHFIFWEENFTVTEKSKAEGYDAVLGYVPFDSHICWKMKQIIKRFEKREFSLPFFLTAENHNTKRAATREGSINFSKMIWTVFSLFPSIKFIHNGFELCETIPVNTGLGFSDEEIASYPPQSLPLFSAAALNWNNSNNIISHIKAIENLSLFLKNYTHKTKFENLKLIETNEFILAFLVENEILCVANYSNYEQIYNLNVKKETKLLEIDICTLNKIEACNEIKLMPYEAKIFLFK